MELLSTAVADQIIDLQKIPVDELPARRAEKFLAMTRDVELCAPDNDADDK